MNEQGMRRYVQHLKEENQANIADSLFEKDYQLSLFLSSLQQLKSSGDLNFLSRLVLKGGTLLSRNYLHYHRISEDLDFSYADSGSLIRLSQSRREAKIKSLIKGISEEIQKIALKSGMSFETDRKNKKFITVRNSRAVYELKVYYKSIFEPDEKAIKIEINFVEKLNSKPKSTRVNNVIDVLKSDRQFLNALGYDLQNAIMLAYPLEEIILEKYRAILTRPEVKDRDLFDLFLINEERDVLKAPISQVIVKIRHANMISPNNEKNLKRHYPEIKLDSSENAKYLATLSYSEKRYEEFKEKLKEHLKKILIRIK